MSHLYYFLPAYVHKQLPFSDEDLSCRHSAETLVGSDEEEGTHPGGNNKPISGQQFSLGQRVLMQKS